MPTKCPRLNLQIPSAIADRLRKEVEFLHVRSRVEMEDGTELKSMADLVRWVVNLYIDLAESGEAPSYDWDETDPVPFTLDSATKGRWEYAIKYRMAISYHELAGNALTWYFERLDATAENDQALVKNLATLPPETVLSYLRTKNYAALQAP